MAVQQLEHAAKAVDWRGCLVSDINVLGSRFAAVACLRQDVHQWRVEHGWAPQPDPAWFHSWADGSTHRQLPVAAVELRGLLVPVSKAKRAVRSCGTLMTVAPCTVVLPGDHPYRPWPLTELDYYGIGVVTCGPDGPADVLLSPEDRTAEFGETLFSRWLLELLYYRVLQESSDSTTGC